MRMGRLCTPRYMVVFAAFEMLFLFVQVFMFYPCLVSAPEEHNAARHAAVHPHVDQPVMQMDQGQGNPGVGKYAPNWESLETRPLPQWYDEAKFGIFMHWGVYSVPSYVDTGMRALSEWFWYYWKTDDTSLWGHKKAALENVRKYMLEHYPPDFQYTDFAPKFTAEFFDADKWADILSASGAKYVVLTSKHHEGFTLWGSKRSWNWNAVDNGPHRDLIAELSTAVRKKTDLKFGLYHSLYEWFNPLYLEDKRNDFKTQVFVRDKVMPELYDLVQRFEPAVIWSDGDWEAPDTYWNSTNFLAWLYNESPVKDIVVTNDRWGKGNSCKHGGYLSCKDRYNPKTSQGRKWENCMTVDQESWGWRRNAYLEDYFDMDGLTEILAQTVSYGGNLLMNIGPTADGRIAPIFEERLRQMGDWLKVNGEAIYGTQVWEYPEDGATSGVYYTKKKFPEGTAVYAIVLEWPEDEKLVLDKPKTGSKTVVTWLGYTHQVEYETKGSAGITIKLPLVSMSKIPCKWAWVFKMMHLANAD